jgi:hypothetical protein
MSRERRRAERYSAQIFINFGIDTTENPLEKRGVIIDVSRLGFAVETAADLEMGREYDCQVELPFSVRLKVMRRIPSGGVRRYGLEIVNSGFLDKLILRRLIKGARYTKKIS